MIEGPQSANYMPYDIIKLFKRDFYTEKNTLEWKITSLGLQLVHKQDVAKGERLEPKANVFKICVKLWRHCEETNVTKHVTD